MHRLRRGERREYLAKTDPKRPNMLMVIQDGEKHGQCAALTGEVGKSVSCAVYPRRANACSDWPRGGTRCRFVLWRSRMAPDERVAAGRYPNMNQGWLVSRPPWWRIQRWWRRREHAKWEARQTDQQLVDADSERSG